MGWVEKQISITSEENHLKKLNFLKRYKPSPKNNTILNDYFLEEFSKSPEDFSEFLAFFEQYFIQSQWEDQLYLAERYLTSLSWLCERFWVFNLKTKLDDAAFKILNKDDYVEISESLRKYQKNSEKIIQEIFSILESILRTYKMSGKVEGRYKNLYSIHKKCKKLKNKNVFKLHDIFAFRIILKGEKENCFQLLNIIHDKFTPLPARFKDYVTIPKVNGYQSLHTGLTGVIQKLDLPIELQIRTEEMHRVAESGIAAHFVYAREKKARILDEKEKKLFEHFKSFSFAKSSNNIYCLTPKWDILKLPSGSSILDFAEKIHSNLRKNARYSFVNGEKKPLTYKMNNGEIIQVIT